jgi:PmbA protein
VSATSQTGGHEALLALASSVAAHVTPGEQLEVYVARGAENSVRVYQGEVEHLVSAQSQGVGIRVIRDGRTGFAYAADLSDDAIREVLAEARDNVRFGSVDEAAALAEPDGVKPVAHDLWSEELAGTSMADKVALALELERRTLALDTRIRVDDANYDDGWGEVAVATSTGIAVSGRENACSATVSTLADDGDETQTGYGWAVGRSPQVFDLDRAAQMAVERATRLLGAVKPASGRVTVVLDPMVTAQFLGIIAATLNGEAIVKGRSPFVDRLGDTIAAPFIDLVDDATDARAYTATDLDGEGLAARRTPLIEGGVLRNVLHSSYSARRAGAVSTGNAVRGGFRGTPGVGALALALAPGSGTQHDLVARVGDGVLIQSVQGLHSGVNPVSGDFSTGASGMLIRGGGLAGPVREFTIASTLQRMLLDVVEVGGDVDWLPMRAAGVSLVIRDITLSGA